MLVLTRRKNQTIHLPGVGVVITIAEVRGDKVRIGIEAPAEIDIARGELLDHEPEFARTKD